jgi:hypothetical protein
MAYNAERVSALAQQRQALQSEHRRLQAEQQLQVRNAGC